VVLVVMTLQPYLAALDRETSAREVEETEESILDYDSSGEGAEISTA